MHHHLIVGGQRSGKSRHAQALALHWCAGAAGRSVAVVATALAHDDEMRARIERHRHDRPAGFETVESPLDLAATLRRLDDPRRLVVVDCLTLWLTNWQMPAGEPPAAAAWANARRDLLEALPALASPVVFVSNELGWGVVPASPLVRAFVDEHGRMNQDVARRCGRITLMVAGQAWTRPVQALGETAP